MKKTYLILIVFLTAIFAHAQKVSFGPVIGFNAYDIEIDGPIIGGGAVSGLNIGGFADYQINRGFGVRGMLTYNTIKENEYAYLDNNQYNVLFQDAELKTLQLHGFLRYDVSGDYNKGFYLTGGLRMVNIMSAKTESEDIESFYKKTNFGAVLGFGVTISRHVGLELMADANLTKTLQADAKAKNYGIYANLTVDVASLINK